jgi:multiple sugar transport system substrate-binding protein
MKRTIPTALGMSAVAALALTACGGGASSEPEAAETGGPVTLTLAGWSLDSTPEFQTLADAYEAENPDVTVEVVEYPAGNDYDTALVADLAGGTAPDVYVIKNLKNYLTFQSGNQLLDISDVAADLDPATGGLEYYEVDGATYAVPYRQDSWVLYYNKDLFAQAGVAEPDGSWTWDDYAQAARDLTAAFGSAGSPAVGTYQHNWQSTLQGFALAQTPDADLFSGDYSWLAPYYERVLALQEEGAQTDYGTITTNSLTYQAQFGTQQAAMLPMGTWYAATLLTQQGSGEADDFAWGVAPIPQRDSSTAGTDSTPVTFGDPTGMGVNPAIDESKVEVAKDFLRFAAGEGGAAALAEIGITPALLNDAIVDTYFGLEGMPTDELSRFAFQEHDTKPENPVAPETAAVQNILNDAHSEIMSGSASVEDALDKAEERVASEVGLG